MVTLDDGSFFLLSPYQVFDLGLTEGDTADPGILAQAAYEHEKARVYEKAVGLLATRDHARVELARKLQKRNFGAGPIEDALGRLESHGYIDDVRFSREFVLARLRRHPEGRPALAARLSGRGVDRGTAEQVLAEVLDEETTAQALYEAADKLAAGGRRGDKLISALLRRGFSGSAVRACVHDRYPKTDARDADDYGDDDDYDERRE